MAALGPYEVPASYGPALLVRRPGVAGADLHAALVDHGLETAWSAHHSWRDAVALGIPQSSAIDAVVHLFETVAIVG